MVLPKKILLAFFSLCVDGIIAAGVYVFLAIIGVFMRLMGRTGTRKHIILYETAIMLGGVLGNTVDTYELPIYVGSFIGTIFLVVAGVCVRIFVGCPVMSLAGTLKTLSIISRRIHLAVGLQYLIFVLIVGKLAGLLVYLWFHMASMG